MAFSTVGSGFSAPIVHDAHCPDIAPVQCETAENEGNPIPVHQHNQQVTFVNVSQQFTYAYNVIGNFHSKYRFNIEI